MARAQPPRGGKAAEAFQLPASTTESLISNVVAVRDAQGNVAISGTILLPRKTKLVIDVFPKGSRKGKDLIGEAKAIVGFGSKFSAGPFEIPKAGSFNVNITSYFNGPWQQPAEVIDAVGEDGKKLPARLLDPYDKEFPAQGGSLNHWVTITVPGLSEDLRAVEAVKNAKLFVSGKGQAVDSVSEIVKFFNKPATEFHPGTWSSTKSANGRWTVSLSHRWGSEQLVANWEYDPASGKVKYLNPEAKMLSWIPAE